jgi:hypothetical protein
LWSPRRPVLNKDVPILTLKRLEGSENSKRGTRVQNPGGRPPKRAKLLEMGTQWKHITTESAGTPSPSRQGLVRMEFCLKSRNFLVRQRRGRTCELVETNDTSHNEE